MTLTQPLSKELYELGVEIKSEKYYHDYKKMISYPQYSTDELLAIIPTKYWNGKIGYDEVVKKYHCWNKWGQTLPEALAKMIIFLIKELGYHYDKEKKCLSIK